jgi:hypothetical protein
MTGPPVALPPPPDPGGSQARAEGQQVEVRTYEGESIRIVPASVADNLIRAQLADDLRHCVRLKLGIRSLPPRFDRPAWLKPMQRPDSGRYGALSRGTGDAHLRKGTLGRSTIDRSGQVYPARHAPKSSPAWRKRS